MSDNPSKHPASNRSPRRRRDDKVEVGPQRAQRGDRAVFADAARAAEHDDTRQGVRHLHGGRMGRFQGVHGVWRGCMRAGSSCMRCEDK